jgi:hypothetical protein
VWQVADLLPVFAQTLTKPQDGKLWPKLEKEHEIINAFQQEGLQEWLKALDNNLYELVIRLVRDILRVLQPTGLDREGKALVVAWPHKGDLLRCFKIPCKKESCWAGFLADSEDCATFAYMSTKCLETDQVKCTGPSTGWGNTLPLLETAVVCLDTVTAMPKVILKHKKVYFLQKMNCKFFVTAQRPTPSGKVELMCGTFDFSKIQKRFMISLSNEDQKQQVQIRERMTLEDGWEMVSVKAPGSK